MAGSVVSLLIVVASVATEVLLVLKVRFPAFLALLIVAQVAGLTFGAPPGDVIASVRKGLSDAQGFVAVVVGLSAMFGASWKPAAGSRPSIASCWPALANGALPRP